MSPITVFQPDLIYVDERRQARLSDRALEGAPTLVIEIVIPVTSQVDRHIKMALYAAHDVTRYWIVDPDARTIEAYRLEGGAYRLDASLEGVATRASAVPRPAAGSRRRLAVARCRCPSRRANAI